MLRQSSGAKIRLGTPSASLSYLPIMWRCRRVSSPGGVLDVEVIQMAAGLGRRRCSTGAIDYTTIPAGQPRRARAARR